MEVKLTEVDGRGRPKLDCRAATAISTDGTVISKKKVLAFRNVERSNSLICLPLNLDISSDVQGTPVRS